MSNLFHRHQWKEIARTHCGGVAKMKGTGYCSEHLFERMMFGVTTILWECEKCHKIKREELLGKIIK